MHQQQLPNRSERSNQTKNTHRQGRFLSDRFGSCCWCMCTRKDLQNIYLERLLWIIQLKRDPIHKEIMETRDVFVNDDNFDHREALDAAIDKTTFLLKRLFRNTRYPSDIDS